jgi:hypothetical protein
VKVSKVIVEPDQTKSGQAKPIQVLPRYTIRPGSVAGRIRELKLSVFSGLNAEAWINPKSTSPLGI